MHATNEISPEENIEAHIVLVAEDEVILRMTLSDHLRDTGFHVLEAANAEEARKIMHAMTRVDLVISDVHMASEAEGIELAFWLGEHYPEVPVILTSGSSRVAASAAWKTAPNVTDFVPKPYVELEMERLARLRIAQPDSSET